MSLPRAQDKLYMTDYLYTIACLTQSVECITPSIKFSFRPYLQSMIVDSATAGGEGANIDPATADGESAEFSLRFGGFGRTGAWAAPMALNIITMALTCCLAPHL